MTHAIVNNEQTRRLKEIVEIVNVTPEGIAMTNTPFMWNPADDKFYFKKDSKVLEKISKRYGIPAEKIQQEFELRTRLFYELFKRKITGSDQVQKEINEYYKNPNVILKKYGVIQ
jgi:hypothetical protein